MCPTETTSPCDNTSTAADSSCPKPTYVPVKAIAAADASATSGSTAGGGK